MLGSSRSALSCHRRLDTICTLGAIFHPHGGFTMQIIEALKIYNSAGKYVVHIPACRGEELFLFLANHGIESRVSRLANASFDRLEVDQDVNVYALRTILNQWSASSSRTAQTWRVSDA